MLSFLLLGAVDLSTSVDAARALAAFVRALHTLPPPDHETPRSAKAIGRRHWDAIFRETLSGLRGVVGVDVDAAQRAWDDTMNAPAWDGPAVWVHGDLLRDNLLARDGELTGVIDFECYGAGEPALDLTPAWTVFSGAARAAFVEGVNADAAAWGRARNFALRSVMGIRYYEETNPPFSTMSRRTLREATLDPIV